MSTNCRSPSGPYRFRPSSSGWKATSRHRLSPFSGGEIATASSRIQAAITSSGYADGKLKLLPTEHPKYSPNSTMTPALQSVLSLPLQMGRRQLSPTVPTARPGIFYCRPRMSQDLASLLRQAVSHFPYRHGLSTVDTTCIQRVTF